MTSQVISALGLLQSKWNWAVGRVSECSRGVLGLVGIVGSSPRSREEVRGGLEPRGLLRGSDDNSMALSPIA